MRDLLELDHIMWGSDFPHSVSSFPESARWLDEIFEGCPEDVRQQVLVENPCAFFGLDPDATLTPTPAADQIGRPPVDGVQRGSAGRK